MKRYVGERKTPYVPKKQKVELNENRPVLKMILAIVFAVIGILFIGLGVKSCLTVETGWNTISTDLDYYDDEFTFLYYLDEENNYKKAVSTLYTSSIQKAYQIFSAFEDIEDDYNLRYINANPNVTITINSSLYDALQKILDSSSPRLLMMGPVYYFYSYIFDCETDNEAHNYDTDFNSEFKGTLDELLDFISDPDMISLELFDNHKVRLNVSTEYLNYANESIDKFPYIDLMYLRNAFICDYVIEQFNLASFDKAIINSVDGYTRTNYSESELGYKIYDYDGEVKTVGTVSHNGPCSVVSLTNFVMSSYDNSRIYTYEDNSYKTIYIPYNSYNNKSFTDSLLCIGDDVSCGKTAINAISIFINDSVNVSDLDTLESRNISTIFINDYKIMTSSDLNINVSNELYSEEILK